MKNTFFIGFLFVQGGLFSQNEANNWGFGNDAGLNFINGIATAATTFNINQSEGCSSISDSLGNLLFYTDGRTVKNQNHVTMVNGSGLEGDYSSTQSALIVKKPASNSIYYIFTISDEFWTDGLRYSIVDISLQGGLGEVTSKNIYIEGQAREKIAAIQHQNGTDFWIITHLRGTNTFNSFRLSSTGLNMTPVTSNIGVSISNGIDAIGCIKPSINGEKVAVARWGLNIVEVFNFNKSTGGLSGLKTLANCIGPYGLEFSPNNNILYVAENVGTGSNVFQYNLLAGNVTAIENSQVALGSYSSQFGSLQLGPDYKIYLAKFNAGSLDVIDAPDSLGTACNYITDGINLLGNSSRMGLSNFSPSILPVFKYSNQCYGDSTSFTIMQNDFDSVLWDFGDVSSGINNNSLDVSPKHLFTNTGVFTVTLIRYKGSATFTKSYSIYISPPTLVSNQDNSICQEDSILLYGVYQNTAGVYYDSLQTINGCDSVLSTTLTVNPLPNVSLFSFNPDILCYNASSVALPTGSPIGGNYAGNGIIGSDFDAAIAGIGVHEIIYSYTDGNQCVNSDTTIVTVDICAGLENMNTDFGIIIHPNPTDGNFSIDLRDNYNIVSVRITDLRGKLIQSKQFNDAQLINLKLEEPIGVYLLMIESEDKKAVIRLIKE